MLRILLVPFLIPVILLVACAQESDAPAVTAKPAEKTAHAESWRDDQLLEGQETYQAACASCHDSGEGGAPVTELRVSGGGSQSKTATSPHSGASRRASR